MPTIFSMPSDQAYRELLNVLPAGQRWFSFDVPMDEARKGNAKRFGMTLWNFHTLTGTREFEAWAITRDPISGAFWYRVAKAREGETSLNRKSLWDALQIAMKMPQLIPMRGILKDGKTRSCAPACVFDISDVQVQADGSALWLKLKVPGDDAGTACDEQQLPPMTIIQDAASTASERSHVIPEEHYLAVRDAAVRVFFEEAGRQNVIQSLHLGLGINESTASALLNNFRCLIQGQNFKAPMRAVGLQLFIDAIVAKLGDTVVPNVIAAVEGYVSYAETAWGNKSAEFRKILNALKSEWAQETLLQQMAKAAESALPTSPPQLNLGPSEILREVWVRGPQHAAFRRELLRRWKDRCSVHVAPCNDQLRASHIVPWSQDETIRGSVNNGLLLSVPLDNLFDRGLISFDDTGALIASSNLSPDTAEHFGVRPGLRIAWDHLMDQEKQALRANLARHRGQHKEAGFLK
jgi:HNH endonuclease